MNLSSRSPASLSTTLAVGATVMIMQAAHAQDTRPAIVSAAALQQLERGRRHNSPQRPAAEARVTGDFKAANSMAASPSPDSTLSAPVVITYAGSSPALTVTDTGSNKGILSIISNSRNASSALFGQTTGSGAGLTGYNYGSSGPAGKFIIVNGENDQPAAYAMTNGNGPAVLGTVDNNSSESPAVYGQNTGGDQGVGVEGDGNVGVFGYTESGIAVSGFATSGTAVLGQSEGTFGVMGEDYGSGTGIYGYSQSGYAGLFQGPVNIEGTLTVNGVNISSDRALKTGLVSVDAKQILDRIGAIPISSWNYKADLTKRHVGPMAQDFHAAFGLDGDDDTHINLTDIAGISLAGIQELSAEMKQKDVEIAELKHQLKVMSDEFATRMTVLERQERRSRDSELITSLRSNYNVME